MEEDRRLPPAPEPLTAKSLATLQTTSSSSSTDTTTSTSTSTNNITSSSSKKDSVTRSLLSYLDFLKPLLLQDNALIRHALQQYDKLQGRIRAPDPPPSLETFQLSLANARIFFPSSEPSIERILQLLSFRTPLLGPTVYFLDVLTVLVIIFRGSLSEKARFLFDWYNVSKTGVLTEVEHTVLIRRTSECFYKIKAIGIIDLTEEDARHIAMEARIYKSASTGQLKFIPGLTFDDFYRWTRDSAESALLVKFVRVLDRLVDTLIAIRNRVDAVRNIIEEKQVHRQQALHVPKLDMFPSCRLHPTSLLVMYRSQTLVTLCMSALGLDISQSSAGGAEVYVMCEKLSTVPNPLYLIPETIQERTSKFRANHTQARLPKCCSREYVLRSYQRFPLNKEVIRRGGPYLRVNIGNLDPNSQYLFTCYTPTWKFSPVGAMTLSEAIGNADNPVSLAILPASLSLHDTDMFVSSTPALQTATALVVTGTLCPVEPLLRSSLLYAENSSLLGNNSRQFAVILGASCNALYASAWSDCVNRMIGICSAAAAAARLGGMTPSHNIKHVFYHNGMGPWGNSQLRDQMQTAVGSIIFDYVYTELERIYSEYASTISPPRYFWNYGNACLVFVGDHNGLVGELQTITVSTLTKTLENGLLQQSDDETAANNESPFRCSSDITVIIRSPLDLMMPANSWKIENEEESNEKIAVEAAIPEPITPTTPLVVAVEPTNVAPAPRLTGRHELLHGEYSKSNVTLTTDEVARIIAPIDAGAPPIRSKVAAPPPQKKKQTIEHLSDPSSASYDSIFNAFIQVVFDWVGSAATLEEPKSVTMRLISSGWNNGVNFEIVHKASGNRIEHICLLQTRTQADERAKDETKESLDKTDALLARMLMSMPEGCSLSILASSPLRAVVVKSSVVEVIPINKIYDKTIQPLGSVVANLPRARVLDGPRISRLSCDDVHVSVTAVGYGRILCTLYELPFELDQQDAVALLSAEKDKLRFVAQSWQRCTKRRQMLFHFRNLLPYCNYCVSVEPEDTSLPLAAQFRTLYTPTSSMSSVILAAVSEADYSVPAIGLGKICHILSGLRPPAAPVHLMHHFSRRKRNTLGIDKPHKVDLQRIHRRANVVHTLARPSPVENLSDIEKRDEHPKLDILSAFCEYDSKFSPIQVSYSGRFCRLAPRDGSERCLQLMVEAVHKLETLRPEIENLLVLTQRPLVRFLQKQSSGAWTHEGLGGDYMHICCKFIDRVLLWKANSAGRDCQIVCFAEVPAIQVVTIGYRRPSSSYNDKASIGILDKESFTEIPIDLLSSSVAYSDKDVDSIESRSLLDEVVEGDDAVEELAASEPEEAEEASGGDVVVEATDAPADPDLSAVERETILDHLEPSPESEAVDVLPDAGVPTDSADANECIHTVDPTTIEKILHEDEWLEPTKPPVMEKILHEDGWEEKQRKPESAPPVEIILDDLMEPSFAETEEGFYSVESKEALDEGHYGPNVNIRHIILPVWEYSKSQDSQSMIVFPDGLNLLGSKLEYFLNREATNFSNVNIKKLEQNRVLYGRGVDNVDAPETSVFLLDFFIRPGEGNVMSGAEETLEPYVDKPEESVIGSQTQEQPKALKAQESIEITSRNRKPYQYHHLLTRSFIHNVDFFEILMGPVIGDVSCNTARILLEVNLDLVELKIVARPLRRPTFMSTGKVIGDEEEVANDVILNLSGVKAYKVTSCLFENLLPGRIYQIFMPVFTGDAALGSFRTPKTFNRFVEVVFAGQDGFQNISVVQSLLSQFYSQQMIDCKFLFRELRTCHASKISSLLSGSPPPSVPGDNMWALVAEHLQTPLTESHMVIHLGSQSFLTYFLKDVVNALLEHGRRLFLPLRDACAIEAYYFNQFEEVVRDMFRLVWSIPILKNSLSCGSHMPLFISEYLLSTSVIPDETLANEGDKKLIAVIRKVYETHFTTYVCSLYNWNPDMVHHGRVWRSGPLAIIMLDLVTGRKKLKKKTADSKGGDEGNAKKKADKFSLGFLDKAQWTLIKNVAEDEFITQIVICSQLPFLSLYDIPFEALEPPKELPKGESLEWSPTMGDLEQFLMYWIEWLQPKPSRAVVSKNIAFVSSNFLPYTTTVQDLMTGSKIQQVCVGIFNANAPSSLPVDASDFQLNGKIGRLRYLHKFSDQDHVVLDCSSDGAGGGRVDGNVDLSTLAGPNYAVLNFCFDSWKAVGNWSIINESELVSKVLHENPRLLIGPILGPPEVYEQHEHENIIDAQTRTAFRVGIMIEVDGYTSVTFAAQDAFTNEVQHFTFDCVPYRPIICSIGPLKIASRYNVKIVKGIRASHSVPFVISTHMDISDSNFVFINAKIPDDTIPNEDFPKDLLQRLKVPFSGITVTVHLNSHPNFAKEIEELRRLPFLTASLAHCKNLGHLTTNVFNFLSQTMEGVRSLYRRHLARPAYREVLRSSYTLFMQTFPIFKKISHVDNEGDAIDEQDVVESESEATLRFIQLMFTRVEQEYFEQLNRPNENVLRAMFKPEPIINVEELGGAADLTEEEKIKILELEKKKELMVEELSIQDDISADEAIKFEKSNPEAHPVKVVFKQWLRDMAPMPIEWFDWVSPNRKAIIELNPSIELSNLIAMFRKFETSPIEVGVRVVVIDGKLDGTGIDSCFEDDGRTGMKLFNQALKFKGGGKNGEPNRIDRDICFVSPTDKYGTVRKLLRTKEDDDEPDPEDRVMASIFTVDSIFRCNAAERAFKLAEAEKAAQDEAKLKEKEEGKAKSKKVKAARAEEERLRILQNQQVVQDILANLVPDGYLFVEARTMTWTTLIVDKELTDTMTTVNARIVNSMRMDVTSLDPTSVSSAVTQEGYEAADTDNAPSLVDYVQIPTWLQKFFPSHEGVFVQDDILLIMRQEPETREVLKQLEGDEIVALGVELYERSRLSELSRPADLREVNMDAPGVVALFLKDLVDRYWEEVVPENVRPYLVPLYDDFLRSFILSRALPEPQSQLAAADAFARGMQHALVLSVSLKLSMDLAVNDPERYEMIMKKPTEAEAATQILLKKDKLRQDVHDRAQFRDIDNYDAAAVDEQVREMEEQKAAKNDYDSDLEDLEEEERQVELEERRKEEEEEAADRLEELREQEEEEAEAAKEAAGLLVEEEEEVEEEEPEEEPEIFDEELASAAAEEQKAKEKEDKKVKRPEHVKSKTKAEKAAEKAAADEVTMIDAMKEALEPILDLGFGDAVETIALEHIFEANLDELMLARPPLEPAARIAEAVLCMSRLAKEKVTRKRNLGKRLLFLNN